MLFLTRKYLHLNSLVYLSVVGSTLTASKLRLSLDETDALALLEILTGEEGEKILLMKTELSLQIKSTIK